MDDTRTAMGRTRARLAALVFLGLAAVAVLMRLSPVLCPITDRDLAVDPFPGFVVLDRRGELLQEVLSLDQARRTVVALDEVSPYLVDAFLAAEDRRFFGHGGVDWPAMARAAWQNLRAGKIVSGGSTITLQLARMIRPAPRTLPSKIREIYRAWRIEAGMSKGEILAQYLNRVPMGGNVYGVEAGARCLLGLSAADLTLAQAAFLAAIPNSPGRMNPFRDRDAVALRQATILGRMARLGIVDAQRARREEKSFVTPLPQEVSFAAPHFVLSLAPSLPPGAREVRTTIDGELQRRVSRHLSDAVTALGRYNVTAGAAILVDSASGDVLAYVGSHDFFDAEDGGAIDGVRIPRQPGSALKPFLYSLAFEGDFDPASVLPDIPAYYRIPNGIYSPRNYSEVSYGPVRLRTALANSLNVPAVRLCAETGVRDVLTRLRSFGFSSLDKGEDYYGLGLVLGGGEVTPLEMAGAYAALARGGEFAPLRQVLSVDGAAQGEDIQPARVADCRSVFMVTDILSDRFARSTEFGVDSVLSLPFPCAVKTGTSYRFCDNWTAGFTADYTLVVWVGNFDRTPMQKVSGVTGAGPVFARIMLDLYRGRSDPGTFAEPEGLDRVKVCALTGQRPNGHCPSTVEELVYSERVPSRREVCDAHVLETVDARNGYLAGPTTPLDRRHEAVFVRLPAIYHRWQEKVGLPFLPAMRSGLDDEPVLARPLEEGDFSISRPVDGAVYVRLPDLEAHYQSIVFAAVTPAPDLAVRWFVDGRLVGEAKGAEDVLWTAVPGEHRLVARGPLPGMEQEIGFSVR